MGTVRRSLTAAGLTVAVALVTPGSSGGGPVAPVLTSVTPAAGPVSGGQLVTIRGSGFLGPARLCARGYDIWFGTDAAEGFAISPPRYEVLSDTAIRAVLPANYGGPVDVRVHNSCGTSGTRAGDRFTYSYPDDECLGGTCEISVGNERVGSLTHVADGLLNGFSNLDGRGSPRLRALLDALQIRQWRMNTFDPTKAYGRVFAYCDACRGRTKISFDLTSDWQNASRAAGSPYVASPFANLTRYGAGMYEDVKRRLQAHHPLSYFDPWNEPTGATIDAWLSVYGAAYRAITAADPGAKLVGPSLDTFLTVSPHRSHTYGYKLNLTDFLDWEMRTGVRFAAISWHEDGSPVGVGPSGMGAGVPPAAVPGGRRDAWSPAAIGEHVLEARRLLSRYPALSDTKVFVNEYGPPWAINIPGWMVGDFAALERSGADQAMMTCASDTACTNLFDGLVGFDAEPQMPYWVMHAYAHMGGARLAVATRWTNLYALATRVAASRTVQLLIGRADDCWGEAQCPQFHASSTGPAALAVSVAFPWRAARATLTLQALRNDARSPIGLNDVSASPPVISRTVAVVKGRALVSIPEADDGDAFYATLSAADVPGRR